MGNEHEHIAKMCEWLMVRTDVDETKGDMVRVFDAERTDNCCRRLSASRYAHLFFFCFVVFFTNLQMFQRPKPQVFMSVWCLCHFRPAFQSLPLCSTPTLTLTLKVPVVVWHFEGLVTVRLYVLQFVCSKTRDCSSPSSLSWTDSKCVNEGSVGRCWETLWQPW